MLADQFLPEYHFNEVHSITIEAAPHRIFELVDEMDFSGSWVIRLLFALRGLGANTVSGKDLLRKNFILLGKVEDAEVAFGLVGQFWRPDGNLKQIAPSDFRAFFQPEFLKAVWTFELTRVDPGTTLLVTETRIECLDKKAKSRFAKYWFFVRPFSGLIRKEMLRAIKLKAAEKNRHA
jgi:hypothetical protein